MKEEPLVLKYLHECIQDIESINAVKIPYTPRQIQVLGMLIFELTNFIWRLQYWLAQYGSKKNAKMAYQYALVAEIVKTKVANETIKHWK